MSIKLSVIIPAYKEERVIKETVETLKKGLDGLPYEKEILVVVDGSPDSTAEQARQVNCEYLRVLEYKPNRGKGYAIYYGVKHCRGEIVTFFDAGGDFAPDHIDRFVKLMEAFDADMVIGSKRHPASKINYPLKRRIVSQAWYYLIKLLFWLNVTDTQTGMKMVKRHVLERIMPRAVVKRYAFDLELLVIARKLGYTRVFEAPVNMNFNIVGGGAANFQAIRRMVTDMLAIWYRLHITHYYDRPHLHITEHPLERDRRRARRST